MWWRVNIHYVILLLWGIPYHNYQYKKVIIVRHPFLGLTLNLLTWRIWWAPNNASNWQIEFNSTFTYLLTPWCSPSWEANWFSASQEIPRISRNPKVHYRTHKRTPTVSILGQPNLIHIPTSHLLEIRPNIIHPSTPRSPQCSPSLRFPHQDPIQPLSSPIHATCPAHLILLDFITRKILAFEGLKLLQTVTCNMYS